MITPAHIEAIKTAGYTVRKWEGREVRYYIGYRGADHGYVTDVDASGGNATCKQVTKQAGSVKAALRSVLA